MKGHEGLAWYRGFEVGLKKQPVCAQSVGAEPLAQDLMCRVDRWRKDPGGDGCEEGGWGSPGAGAMTAAGAGRDRVSLCGG